MLIEFDKAVLLVKPYGTRVFLLYMLLANMAVLYIYGVLQLMLTGAVPKKSYLTHVLTPDGELPAHRIRFCYHYLHNVNRVRIRDSVHRNDPVLKASLSDTEQLLNTAEFMRIARNLIVHQSAFGR